MKALSTIPVSPQTEKNAFTKPNTALYIRGIIMIRQIDASQTICGHNLDTVVQFLEV